MPTAGKTKLYISFMGIKQRDFSVVEYVSNLHELSFFSSGLIDGLIKKNKMFVLGIREEFHEKMTTHVKESGSSIHSIQV